MEIALKNITKSYNNSTLFKDLTYIFESKSSYVIQGANGSGKSTLLKIISGNILPTFGKVIYQNENSEIDPNFIFNHLAITAPYLDLHEDLTLSESINFHFSFKKPHNSYTTNDIINILNLKDKADNQIKFFSSGMKQRVKLGLSILSETPVLLLDEPTMNLDAKNINWYQNLIGQHKENRLIIVASNKQESDYAFCDKTLDLETI